MSENNDDGSKQKKLKSPKFAIVAAALVTGLFVAVVIGGGQVQRMAEAQQSLGGGQTQGSANATVAPMGYYHGIYPMQTSTIATSGTATTKVDPDKFSVTVGVETNGTTASDAASSNAKLMAQVVAALKGLGINDDQITTSNFNVYPVYNSDQQSKLCPQIYPGAPYCPPNQMITGYHASNSITVTLDTSGSIDAGKVIDISIGAGANNVNGVTFFVSQDKQETIKDALTQQAIANARHRADIAADALGMRISGVQSVNLNDVYFPIYTKSFNSAEAAPMAAMATPIQAGQQDVSTTVGVVFYFSDINGTSQAPPPGMAATKGNTNCTNPPGGPMIC